MDVELKELITVGVTTVFFVVSLILLSIILFSI